MTPFAPRGAAAAWRGVKLKEALGYLEQGAWNEAWAGQLVDRDTRAGELAPEDRLAPFADVRKFIEGEAAAQGKEERAKKRRAAAIIVLLSAVLVLGGTAGFYRLRQAESERRRAESAQALLALQNSEAKLRQQIAASDDLLNQYKKKEQELEDQIAKAGQSAEVKKTSVRFG
jgi:hypothetical protein